MLTSKNLMIVVLLIVAGNISAMDRENIDPNPRHGGLVDNLLFGPEEQAAQQRRVVELETRKRRMDRIITKEAMNNIATSDQAWLAWEIADANRLTKKAYNLAKKAKSLEKREAGWQPNLAPEELFPVSDN